MFKKASMKIMPLSNNSTTTSSNPEVRPIQCLLTAEKAVLQSLQKLSVDYAKASEALRNWGLSEDNDLGGILTASTTLFNHFSLALSQYASHGHTMQRQLEVMAKKGESLDNLKQRRKSAHQKAEDTAHQLNKMNPDNKYYSMHAEALKRLRKDVRKMDEDIRLEETILIDHKKTATKVWMRLKFGGLYECCEKGSVAGKYGKLVTSEFEGVEDVNQPGMPRNIHLQNKIEGFIMEADRHVNAVGLSGVASRTGDRNIPEPSTSPSAASFASSPTVQDPPHALPQNVQPYRSNNGQFPERQDSVYPPPNSVVGGLRRDPSLSEPNGGPSRLQDQPPPSQWQQQQQQPTSTQWQNPYQYPVHMRPPNSEPGYPPPDPPYPTGPPQWQNQPVVLRPPGSSDGYPSSQSGSNLNRNPSYSTGPPQAQSPPRPPVASDPGYPPSQGGSSLNGNSSYSRSPPRPPVPSDPGYAPSQGGSSINTSSSYSGGPPLAKGQPRPSETGYFPSQGGSQLNSNPSYSAGPSGPPHLPSQPPRPPGPPESVRYNLQDQPPMGARRPSDSSGQYAPHDPHWQNHPSDRYQPPPPQPSLQPPPGGHPGNQLHNQGPSNTGPNGSPSQVSYRTGGSSYPESTNSQWPTSTNRFSDGSESTSATSEGMSRPRDNSFNNQSMHTWGAGGDHPDDSPPAYMLMGHPESLVSDTGSKGRKWRKE